MECCSKIYIRLKSKSDLKKLESQIDKLEKYCIYPIYSSKGYSYTGCLSTEEIKDAVNIINKAVEGKAIIIGMNTIDNVDNNTNYYCYFGDKFHEGSEMLEDEDYDENGLYNLYYQDLSNLKKWLEFSKFSISKKEKDFLKEFGIDVKIKKVKKSEFDEEYGIDWNDYTNWWDSIDKFLELPDELLDDKKFILRAIEKLGPCIVMPMQDLLHEIFHDKELALALFTPKDPKDFSKKLSKGNMGIFGYSQVYEILPEELELDKDIIIAYQKVKRKQDETAKEIYFSKEYTDKEKWTEELDKLINQQK